MNETRVKDHVTDQLIAVRHIHSLIRRALYYRPFIRRVDVFSVVSSINLKICRDEDHLFEAGHAPRGAGRQGEYPWAAFIHSVGVT